MAAKADTTAGIRKLWGIAKSPELRLSDEDLHLVVQAHRERQYQGAQQPGTEYLYPRPSQYER